MTTDVPTATTDAPAEIIVHDPPKAPLSMTDIVSSLESEAEVLALEIDELSALIKKTTDERSAKYRRQREVKRMLAAANPRPRPRKVAATKKAPNAGK